MVTSSDILKATGIKSPKTLTRWHKMGIIPTPSVRTHPSGRGKISFWPDWVLDRCVRINELRKEGHDLQSALGICEAERFDRIVAEAEEEGPLEKLEGLSFRISPKDERRVKLFDLLAWEVARSASSLLGGGEAESDLLRRLRDDNVVRRALELARNGFNPIALVEPERIAVVPDFVVSHRLSGDPAREPAQLLLPLQPPLHTGFKKLTGEDYPYKPSVFPVARVKSQSKNETTETAFYPGGVLGFEMLHDTTQVIGGPEWSE